jgi:chromosome segregation ATPase
MLRGVFGLLSKVKEVLAASENLDEISKKVKAVSKGVTEQSKELAALRKEVSDIKSAVRGLCSSVSKMSASLDSQMGDVYRATDDLKEEVYDFKLIKAEIKSKLVSELTDDFRKHLSEETRKLDVDVKSFNELKEELSRLVTKFRSVEGEIEKFRAIAQEVKAADFQLSRHAKELAAADSEKLKLLQKIDQMESLVAKMRRSR